MVEKPKTGAYLGLSIYSLILLLPIFWMFITSFKTPSELYKNRLGLPEIWHFENYTEAVRIANIGKYFANTIIVVLVVLVIAVFFASMAAYILARYNHKVIAAIELFFIAGLMVPMQAVVVPIYSIAIKLNSLNNLLYLGLIEGAFALPLSILILTSFIRVIPSAIEESAVIDGCNRLQIYGLIILPVIREGLISAAILAGLNAWNELLLPLLMLSRENVKTISIGMRSFFTQYGSSPTLLLAACFISMIPVLLLYAVLQERMVKGLTAGAVKG
jgi:raffinose/stachyose/melibiose transport system permease protein